MPRFHTLPLLLSLSAAGCSFTAGLSGAKAPAPAAPAPAPSVAATAPPPIHPASGAAQAPPSQARRTDGKTDGTPGQWRIYKDLTITHHEVLRRLSELDSERPFSGMPMDAQRAAAALEAMRGPIDAFGALGGAACGEYHDLALMDLQPWEEPRWVCDHARRTSELIPTMARSAIATLARAETEALRGTGQTLRKGYPVSDHALEVLLTSSPADRRAQAIAALQPLVPLAGDGAALETLIPELDSETREAVAVAPDAGDKFKYHRRAPGPVAKVAADLFSTARYRGARPEVKGVLARDHDWAVTRDAYSKVPIRRTHRTQVVAQVTGEPFCRMYEVDVNEAYMGGGTWGLPATAGTETGPRVVTCKLE